MILLLIPISYSLFTLFFANLCLLTRDHSLGIMSKVILGGKDMTGMAYPEGFR